MADNTRVIVEIAEVPPGFGDCRSRELERLLSEVATAWAGLHREGDAAPQAHLERITAKYAQARAAGVTRQTMVDGAAYLLGAALFCGQPVEVTHG